MRAYFRIDPKMVENKLKAGYTPAQIGAYVMLLSQAEQQPHRGRFRSLVELKAAMDCMVEEAGPSAAMSKYVPFLLKQRDVVKLDGGPYYVDGWDEWQEGNWQVAERMRRVRERKHAHGPDTPPITRADTGAGTPVDTARVTPPVTVDVTVGVTPDVTARDARRGAGAATPIVVAAPRPSAVSREQEAAYEAALPLPLPPEVLERNEALRSQCSEIVVRPLKGFERDLILGWASTLRREGEFVPVDEVMGLVRYEMAQPTPDGTLPSNLAWCADKVATLARGRAVTSSMPLSVRQSMSYDQQLAEYAEQLRQEGR